MPDRAAVIAGLRREAAAHPAPWPPATLPAIAEFSGVAMGLSLQVDPAGWYWLASVSLRDGRRPIPTATWGLGSAALADRLLAEMLDGLGDPLTDERSMMRLCRLRRRMATAAESVDPTHQRAGGGDRDGGTP